MWGKPLKVCFDPNTNGKTGAKTAFQSCAKADFEISFDILIFILIASLCNFSVI